MLLLDDRAIDDKQSQKPWRRWISWFNHLQILPGMFLMTTKGLANNDYAVLAEAPIGGVLPPSSGDDLAWQNALANIIKAVMPGMIELSKTGVQPPDDFGLELPDENGEVIAEAEAAWTPDQIVLLTPAQEEFLPEWISQGWKAIKSADENWPAQVAELLNAKKD
jgi:hypothetical protein